jgi:hypothetical protein
MKKLDRVLQSADGTPCRLTGDSIELVDLSKWEQDSLVQLLVEILPEEMRHPTPPPPVCRILSE